MKRNEYLMTLASALAGLAASAAGLIPNGDFSADPANPGPGYRANGATFTVFTEDQSWNRCGRFTAGRPVFGRAGNRVTLAELFCGCDAAKLGVPLEPETTYAFAFEIRGDIPNVKISLEEWWSDDAGDQHRVEPSVGWAHPKTNGWTLVKGTARTTAKVKRAALRLGIYSNSELGMAPIPEGASFLVDNVRLEAVRNRLDGPVADDETPRRKAIAVGADKAVPLADFTAASVAIRAGDAGLVFDIACESPSGVSAGSPSDVWSGETVEIFIGDASAPARAWQFAFNPSGAKFTGNGRDASGANGRWALKTETEGAGRWTARVGIPYAMIGMKGRPESGATLPFNLARGTVKPSGWHAWMPFKASNFNVADYGTMVFGSYAAAFGKRWGKTLTEDSREAFETRTAEEETAERKARFERFKAGRFSIAPVSASSDFGVPFLPEEIFDPPAEIRLRAAVNEVKALPLALANLTDAVAQYRVIVETEPEKGRDDGVFGLKGFPSAQISCREAIRFKETDAEPITLRLDPLVEMNEVRVTTVPAKETGLVWFDFDTTGVKPGVYRGRVRVLPLGERTGRTMPLSLEVVPVELPARPVRPSFLCGRAENESAYRLFRGLGSHTFMLTPWHFQFELDAKGNLDLARPRHWVGDIRRDIRRHKAWAAKYGDPRPRFEVAYSTWHAMCSVYGLQKDPEGAMRLWPQFLEGIRKVMSEEDVKPGEYVVETWDEPKKEVWDTVYAAHRLAKDRLPEVRLELTLGHAADREQAARDFRRLIPLTDGWMNWSSQYFSGEYLELAREAQRRGAEVAHYSCGTSIRAPISTTYRLMPWFGERYGLDADCIFQFIHATGGDGCMSFKKTPYGDIAYRSFDTYVPSLRYMAIREGQTDIRYLAALRKARGNEPEVARFLAEAPVRVVDENPHDASLPPALREQALDLLLR